MSNKTTTSVPTVAILNAQAADQETTDVIEEPNETITITFNKKVLKKALFGTIAAAAVTYVATRLLSSSVDEDSDETTED